MFGLHIPRRTCFNTVAEQVLQMIEKSPMSKYKYCFCTLTHNKGEYVYHTIIDIFEPFNSNPTFCAESITTGIRKKLDNCRDNVIFNKDGEKGYYLDDNGNIAEIIYSSIIKSGCYILKECTNLTNYNTESVQFDFEKRIVYINKESIEFAQFAIILNSKEQNELFQLYEIINFVDYLKSRKSCIDKNQIINSYKNISYKYKDFCAK